MITPPFAVLLAGWFESQPFHGPIILWLVTAFAIFAGVAGLANRKKLNEINKASGAKGEPLKVIGEPWKCPKCGEKLEPQFGACWHCGTIRKLED